MSKIFSYNKIRKCESSLSLTKDIHISKLEEKHCCIAHIKSTKVYFE